MRLPRPLLLLAGTVIAQFAPAAAPDADVKLPDFLKGDPIPKNVSHDWTLGPTGARGYFPVSKARGKHYNNTTFHARQILITKVDPGSPADGKLSKGDVILGIDGKQFQHDARKALGAAITDAERPGNNAKLRLLRWRQGETESVDIQLRALGVYSPTAPYNCAKSKAILEAGCIALADHGLDKPSIANHINALALLASGKPEYLPMLRKYAQAAVEDALEETWGLKVWHYGFANLFLTEYFLLTKDAAVLPGIRHLSLNAANGQSPNGNWGHNFIRPDVRRLPGYGAVNACALPLALSLSLAVDCGIDDQAVKEAVSASTAFYSRYVGLGSIPYGDHIPGLLYGHDDNGKNAAAAVFFDAVGNERATRFFARMTTIEFGHFREEGHTGNFLNMLWSLMGVSRAGPRATGAWLKQFAWYFDLARTWEFGFPYQGNVGMKSAAYANWYCPGAYLLSYALPLKVLRITGARPCAAPPLTPDEVDACISAGRNEYWRMDAAALTECLSDWSPAVRHRATQELKKRGLAPTADPAPMLRDPRPERQCGGLRALMAIADSATRDGLFDAAAALLDAPNPAVQIAAAKALCDVDRKRAAPVLFKHVLRSGTSYPPDVSQVIVYTLLSSGGAAGCTQVLKAVPDRKLALDTIRLLIRHPDAWAAKKVAAGIAGLPDAEARALLPDLHHVLTHPPDADVMFMDALRIDCLKLLAKYHVSEGLAIAVALATESAWGQKTRLPGALGALKQYGVHAKPYAQTLREAADAFPKRDKKWPPFLREGADAIEKLTEEPKLEPLAEAAQPR